MKAHLRNLFVAAICSCFCNAGYGQSDSVGILKCMDANFRSNGTKEDTINKIVEQGECIKKQQRDRIGKWFCYTTEMAGIQKQKDGTIFSGRIKPDVDRFVVTITELNTDAMKRLICEEHEFGLAEEGNDLHLNSCLANFRIEFSPRVAVLGFSKDTYSFRGAFSTFTLFGTKEFVLFLDESPSFYVERGKCEKIN